MHEVDLETLVDRELRRLPAPRAPHTLLPRVVMAVQQWAMRPWYARAWVTWPLEWQALSMAALIVLLVGGTMLIPIVEAAAAGASATFAPGVRRAADVAHRAEATVNAGRILWRALVEPFVAYVFALVALMCLGCAVLGTALNRVALGRTLQS